VSFRVPTADVNRYVDLTVRTTKDTSYDAKSASGHEERPAETYLKGSSRIHEDEVVSSDFSPLRGVLDFDQGSESNEQAILQTRELDTTTNGATAAAWPTLLKIYAPEGHLRQSERERFLFAKAVRDRAAFF
jgi:hypothetical protein